MIYILQGFNSNIRILRGAYETTCLSGTDCMSDLRALNADSSCVNAINNGLTDVSCTGNCRDLIEDAFDTCPMVSDVSYSYIAIYMITVAC